ncbi:MAG TPA: sialidase family protein [Candidatus Binatia bacterium]|nr:sialidase family protein [Candidatus Binatia bacterium]
MREKTVFLRRNEGASLRVSLLLCFVLVTCSEIAHGAGAGPVKALVFGAEQNLGKIEKNPSTPFLRYSPDGRLYAVWTEDHDTPWSPATSPAQHQHGMGDRAPSPMRNALLAYSTDGGKSWSAPRRINDAVEAVQGEENGPKIVFGPENRAYAVWSIPGDKGDKTRANIRFAMDEGKGGFTPAKTLNEVKDAARFPILELSPDGNLLIAWIDRRIDNPKPRQLYLMQLHPNGKELTKNYSAGEGLCECCKLGVASADGGKTVYLVDRQVDDNQIRNHVLRKSMDRGKTFAAPVVISDDGWQVPSCPHSGPSIGRDSRGWLHVTWFTLGRTEREAGIYYSVSSDGGKSFQARRLVHANTAPEILYSTLAVGSDDTVYLAWSNLDNSSKAQVFLRTLSDDGRSWGPIQQLSNAKGNAGRPVLAVSKNQLHVAWTEIHGEESRVVLRSAMVSK